MFKSQFIDITISVVLFENCIHKILLKIGKIAHNIQNTNIKTHVYTYDVRFVCLFFFL